MKRTAFLGTALVLTALAVGAAGDDLARARALDQEGVRLYKEGHYHEAISQFREAREAGGPPFELWNIARCHGRLGENKEEADVIEKYLAEPGLSKSDRAEAQAELSRLQRLSSAPPPATPEQTPHARPEHGSDAPVPTDKPERAHGAGEGAPADRGANGHEYSIASSPTLGLVPSFGVGVLLPQYGSVGGSPHAEANLRVLYKVWEKGPSRVLVGGRMMVTGDSWDNNVDAPTRIQGCGNALYSQQDATTYFVMGVGAIERSILSQLRVGGEAGVGGTFFVASQVGGDLFTPSCNPGTKVEPSFLFAVNAAFDVTKRFRIQASPLLLDFAPSFDNARSQPKDATGLWVRVGAELGLAFEF